MSETARDKIIVQDLLARCIVGLNPDEREAKQDVLLKIGLSFQSQGDCAKALLFYDELQASQRTGLHIPGAGQVPHHDGAARLQDGRRVLRDQGEPFEELPRDDGQTFSDP